MMMHEIIVGSDDDDNNDVSMMEHRQDRQEDDAMEDDVIDEVYTDYYVASTSTSNNNINNSNNNNDSNDSINDDATTTAPTKGMDTATATKSPQGEEEDDEEAEQVQQQQEQQQEHEEECVICFETLSTMEWGRCTPCGHAFHKQCWWEWENVYNQRVDIRNRREGINNNNSRGRGGGDNDKCKCCLCNTINVQFIDGDGNPARNPAPYIAIDVDPSHPSNGGSSGDGGGGNRFTQFIRGMNESANGFISFMRNESNWNSSTPAGTVGGGGGRGGGSFRRMNSFLNNQHAGSSSGGGGRRQQQQQQQQQQYDINPYNTLRPGTQVILQNLAQSSHLNKKRGTILQYQAHTLRYLVQLESDMSTSFIPIPPVSIRAENLLQPIKVQIVNLRSQPHFNGKVGTITAYVRPINRYVIKIETYSLLSTSSREVSVQPCNIRIPNGTLVRLEGLEHASQWNGKYGTIARFVESGLPRGGGGGGGGGGQGTTESGRYQVNLSRQYSVLVKVENVRL
jgi:hypothetical protein